MKRYIGMLVWGAVVGSLTGLVIGARNGEPRHAQIVQDYILAVPVTVADVPAVVKTMGNRLMISGNALDLPKEDIKTLGTIVCGTTNRIEYWTATGQIDQPAPGKTVYICFWADPEK